MVGVLSLQVRILLAECPQKWGFSVVENSLKKSLDFLKMLMYN